MKKRSGNIPPVVDVIKAHESHENVSAHGAPAQGLDAQDPTIDQHMVPLYKALHNNHDILLLNV